MKQLIIEQPNAENMHKRITRVGMIGWKGDPLGIVQEIKIWLCLQMVYALTRIFPRKWKFLELSDSNRLPSPSQKTKQCQ